MDAYCFLFTEIGQESIVFIFCLKGYLNSKDLIGLGIQ